MAYITVEDLSVGYEGKAVAEHISFQVGKGDYLCIVGENGSGKTTLMRTLLHLTSPVSGNIRFGDGLTQSEVGYLPQQTVVQKDFPASAREIVLSGFQGSRKFSIFYTKEEKAQAQANMERMGIFDLADRCYREMSGGQQQRVLLARALCATSKLLLLDEPVAGLDPKVTLDMYALVKKLNEDGISIIMISHDIQAAARYASHILYIGKQIFFGTKEEFLESREWKQLTAWQGDEIEQEAGKDMQTTAEGSARTESGPDKAAPACRMEGGEGA